MTAKVMERTLYGVLGVEVDASESDIVAAYREKVKTHHPDISDAPDARTQFKRIRTAKEVLTDEDRRAQYDSLGHETYVRRYLDDDQWKTTENDVSEAAETVSDAASGATCSTRERATAKTTAASKANSAARNRQYRADGGGTAAGYYRPGERVGVPHRGPLDWLTGSLVQVGPLLLAHVLLLLSTATMAGWLLVGGSGGAPSLTSVVIATAMVCLTGCLSLLHLTTALFD